MWQKILQFSKELLALKGQTEANTNEIKEIREDIRDLTEAVRQLANAIQKDRTKNSHQQELMVERLKNALMQFEIKLLKGEYPNTLNAREKNKEE